MKTMNFLVSNKTTLNVILKVTTTNTNIIIRKKIVTFRKYEFAISINFPNAFSNGISE